MTPPAARKRNVLDEAEDYAATRVTQARKNSSGRIALTALPVPEEPRPVELSTEAPERPSAGLETSDATSTQVKSTKRSKALLVPSWRTLATPPAARGTGGNQRRLNVPCAVGTLKLLNVRDRELLEGGSRWRVNRSVLLSEAIDVLHSEAAPWVERWERERLDEEPYTASLQGRVDDEHYRRYTLLRYLEDGRTVSTGPLLSLVVRDILNS